MRSTSLKLLVSLSTCRVRFIPFPFFALKPGELMSNEVLRLADSLDKSRLVTSGIVKRPRVSLPRRDSFSLYACIIELLMMRRVRSGPRHIECFALMTSALGKKQEQRYTWGKAEILCFWHAGEGKN